MYWAGDHADTEGTTGRTRWVLIGFLAVALFFLLTEHRAHLFGFLPYLLLLVCPFGDAYFACMNKVPAFVPRIQRPGSPPDLERRERHG